MRVLQPYTEEGREAGWLFWCPGCEEMHHFEKGRWAKSGTLDKPTFSPSLVVRAGTDRVCHSFVRDGNIQFLNDCHHELAGQTVAMKDLDEEA